MSSDFTKKTTITFVSGIIVLIVGLATSIILARILGPEGRGIYALAILLPMLIVNLASMGISPATVYYVAQGYYSRQEILGNNIIFALGIGAIGVLGGLIVVLFFQENIIPGVAQGYLLLALALIPVNLFCAYLQNILLGTQSLKEYNLVAIIQAFLFLFFIAVALWIFKTGIIGAILASVVAWFLTNVILFFWAKAIVGGLSFKLNQSYLKKASLYGIQAHLASILIFLNYRIDLFLINGFLSPAEVGFYAVGVGLVEKLWLISYAASTVLFPRVAAENDEQRRREFTPLVARTVLWVTMLEALMLFFLSRWIIELLFSAAFLPAVQPLQILLLGIVALSIWRLLANDLAGRGKPILNAYITGFSVLVNIILNILWIPRYGIAGAAWASVASYGTALVIALFVYCRLSGNPWVKVLLPQMGDWALYRRTGLALGKWFKEKGREAI